MEWVSIKLIGISFHVTMLQGASYVFDELSSSLPRRQPLNIRQVVTLKEDMYSFKRICYMHTYSKFLETWKLISKISKNHNEKVNQKKKKKKRDKVHWFMIVHYRMHHIHYSYRRLKAWFNNCWVGRWNLNIQHCNHYLI